MHVQAWRGLCERLQEWKGANAEDAGDFWAVLSGQAGLGHKALLAMIHLALKSPGEQGIERGVGWWARGG